MSTDNHPESDAEMFPGAVRQLKVSGQRDDQNEKQDAGKQGRQIPTREECMHALAQLPGLIAMKILTAGQANAIRSSYETLLKEHGKSLNGQPRQLSDEDVMKVFREHPETLSLLEPLLTKDQVEMVIKGTKQDKQ